MFDLEKWRVEGLYTAFGMFADRGDGAALSELFVSDGMLEMGNNEVHGRQNIAEFVNARCADPSRKTRHTWSNLRLEQEEGSTFHTTAIQMTFEQNGADKAPQVRVSDLVDTLQRYPDGTWRFVSRRIHRQFTFGA
jgi:hypothetical protein